MPRKAVITLRLTPAEHEGVHTKSHDSRMSMNEWLMQLVRTALAGPVISTEQFLNYMACGAALHPGMEDHHFIKNLAEYLDIREKSAREIAQTFVNRYKGHDLTLTGSLVEPVNRCQKCGVAIPEAPEMASSESFYCEPCYVEVLNVRAIQDIPGDEECPQPVQPAEPVDTLT